jgi:hypothetical protein
VTGTGGTSKVAATGNGAQSEMRSVVIPLIETPAASVTHATTERADGSAPQAASVSRPVDDAPVIEQPLSVLTDADRTVSSAVKYIAQRERARRNRTRLAVLLLVAVIALAAVLVWTLTVGPAALDSGRAKPAFPELPRPALADNTFLLCLPLVRSDHEL